MHASSLCEQRSICTRPTSSLSLARSKRAPVEEDGVMARSSMLFTLCQVLKKLKHGSLHIRINDIHSPNL